MMQSMSLYTLVNTKLRNPLCPYKIKKFTLCFLMNFLTAMLVWASQTPNILTSTPTNSNWTTSIPYSLTVLVMPCPSPIIQKVIFHHLHTIIFFHVTSLLSKCISTKNTKSFTQIPLHLKPPPSEALF